MVTFNPFNELGQILSAGGEISVAIGFSRGRSRTDQLLYVRSRFAPLPDDDEAFLISFSERMSLVSKMMFELDPTVQIPLDTFPRNPFLFGDDFAGNRVAIGLDAGYSDDDRFVQLRLAFPDSPTYEDLVRAAEEELERRKRESPKAFEGLSEEQEQEIIIHILYGERRF